MHRHYIFITWTIAHFQKHRSRYWLKVCRFSIFVQSSCFQYYIMLQSPIMLPLCKVRYWQNFWIFFSIKEFPKQIQITHVLCFILLKRKYRALISTRRQRGSKKLKDKHWGKAAIPPSKHTVTILLVMPAALSVHSQSTLVATLIPLFAFLSQGLHHYSVSEIKS